MAFDEVEPPSAATFSPPQTVRRPTIRRTSRRLQAPPRRLAPWMDSAVDCHFRAVGAAVARRIECADAEEIVTEELGLPGQGVRAAGAHVLERDRPPGNGAIALVETECERRLAGVVRDSEAKPQGVEQRAAYRE